jgi:hypothetical protein
MLARDLEEERMKKRVTCPHCGRRVKRVYEYDGYRRYDDGWWAYAQHGPDADPCPRSRQPVQA